MLLLATLAACSGDSGDSEPRNDALPAGESDADDQPGLRVLGFSGEGPGELTSPWLVNSSFFRLASSTPGSGDAFVSLVQYPDTFPVQTSLDFYAPELDTCELLQAQEPDEENDDGSNPPPTISGGSQILLNRGDERFFTLGAQQQADGQTFYEVDNGLPDALPDDLTLTIPGDEFPAVEAYPLPDEPPTPVRVLPDANDVVTTASEYSWIPGADNDSIRLVLSAFDPNGDFGFFAIGCDLVDDGRFTMPAEAQAEIARIGGDLRARYTRNRRTLELRDGIVIFSRIAVAE